MSSRVFQFLVAVLVSGHAAAIIWIVSRDDPREWFWRTATGILAIVAAVTFAYLQLTHRYEAHARLLRLSLLASPAGLMLFLGLALLARNPASGFVFSRLAILSVVIGALLLLVYAVRNRGTNTA